MRTRGKPWSLALAVLLLAAWVPTQVRADDTKYITKDIEIVTTINFRQVLKSPLFKDNKALVAILRNMMEDQIRQSAELTKLQKALDFDPLRDLHRITFAGQGDKEQKKAIVIANGNFKKEKFEAFAAHAISLHPDQFKAHKAAGQTIYEVTPPGHDALYVSLPGKTTLLVTKTLPAMQQALAQNSGAKMGQISKELKGLLTRTSAKQSFSFVATKSALKKIAQEVNNAQLPQLQPVIPFLKEIDGFVGTVTVAKDIGFQAGIDTKNAKKAQELAQQTSQVLLFASLTVQNQAQQNPQLAPLADVAKTLRASSEGATMNVNGRVPANVIQHGIKMLKVMNQ